MKLKDSCAACAMSKVKCDKVRPSCKRCVRRGINCIYEPSYRAGRHARRAGPSHEPIFVPVLTSTNLSSEQAALAEEHSAPATSVTDIVFDTPIYNMDLDPMLPVGQAYTGDSTWRGLSPASTGHLFISNPASPGTVPSLQFSLSPSQLDEARPEWSPQDGGSATPNVLDQFCQRSNDHTPVVIDSVMLCEWPSVQVEHGRNELPSNHAMAALKPPLHEELQSSGNGSKECCLAKIACILEGQLPGDLVGPMLSTVSSVVRTKKPALEDVIAIIQQTIDELNFMLECPCLQDNFVTSLMPLAVQRIMTWYDAASQRPLTQSASALLRQCSANISAISGQESIEAILCLAKVLGEDCVLSPSEQRQVAASLVLGGLHKVQRFIALLSGHPQATFTNTNGDRKCTQQGTTLSKETFLRLLTDLRESVHFTVSKILTELRAEQLGEPIPLLLHFHASVWT